jgi:DNA polymerase III gamma/tau subunit
MLDEAMTTMRRSTNPRLVLEMVLIRSTRPAGELTYEALAQRIESLEQRAGALGAPAAQDRPVAVAVPESAIPAPAAAAGDTAPSPASEQAAAPAASSAVDAPTVGATDDGRAEQIWRIALTRLRETNPSRYPLFVDTHATFDAKGTLTISYKADQGFRMKQAGERDNLALLAAALREASGTDHVIDLRAGDEVIHAPVPAIDTPKSEPVTPTVAEEPAVAEPPAEEPAQPAASPVAEEPAVVEPPTPPAEPEPDSASHDELLGALDALGATVIETHENSDTTQ